MSKLTSKQYRNKLSNALGTMDDIESYCDQEKASCITSCEDLEDLLIDVIQNIEHIGDNLPYEIRNPEDYEFFDDLSDSEVEQYYDDYGVYVNFLNDYEDLVRNLSECKYAIADIRKNIDRWM